MNKSEIIKEINHIIVNSEYAEAEKRIIKTDLQKVKYSKLALQKYLNMLYSILSFNPVSGKYIPKPIEEQTQIIKLFELNAALECEEHKAIVRTCIPGIFQKTIKNINSVFKNDYLMTSQDHRDRKNILGNSFKYSKVTDGIFFNDTEPYSYCYEYQWGSVEFYEEQIYNPEKPLTVIITEMLGSNLLKSEKQISHLCNHFYYKNIGFMEDPLNILWIIERPLSDKRSSFYQIHFNFVFPFEVRYSDEIKLLNSFFDVNLPPEDQFFYLFPKVREPMQIKKIRSKEQVLTVHQLHNI